MLVSTPIGHYRENDNNIQHCRIGLLNPDGTVTSIYCEIDYSHNILKNCYATIEKVQTLLDKGDLRPIECESSPAGCVGPDPIPARTDTNLSEYLKHGEAFNYLYDGECWKVYFNGQAKKL